MSDYNPNSMDAQFAKVLTLLENHAQQFSKKCEEDKQAFAAIMAKQDKTNGRVMELERFRAYLKGKVAAVSLGVSILGTIIGWLISK